MFLHHFPLSKITGNQINGQTVRQITAADPDDSLLDSQESFITTFSKAQ
jgi:hypothetical protein